MGWGGGRPCRRRAQHGAAASGVSARAPTSICVQQLLAGTRVCLGAMAARPGSEEVSERDAERALGGAGDDDAVGEDRDAAEDCSLAGSLVIHQEENGNDAVAGHMPADSKAASGGDFEATRYRLGFKEWVNARTRFLETPEAGEWLGECWGTMLIVVFGVGVVNAGLSGAQSGIWQVAVVWALGVALAVYTTAHVSGAHLNPAITLAFAAFRDFPPHKVPRYIAAQMAGGIIGGCLNLGIFQGVRDVFERAGGITRGAPQSVLTAAAFGEYFPNPYLYGPYSDVNTLPQSAANEVIYPGTALLVEAWGTFLLAFVVFAVTDPKNKAVGESKALAPLLIGFVVGVNLSLYAPITQAGWNPARDLGPRIVAAFAGWQSVALPGPRNGFWVYIVGPVLGALCGGGLYDCVLSRSLYPNDDGGGHHAKDATASRETTLDEGGQLAKQDGVAAS